MESEHYSTQENKRARSSTSMEIIGAFVILALLIAIIIPTYFQYLDKAKLTLAQNTANTISRALSLYKQSHGVYPAEIDFSTGMDDSGTVVFRKSLQEQIKSDFSSVESYVSENKSYILLVRANNKKQTLITLKPVRLSLQE